MANLDGEGDYRTYLGTLADLTSESGARFVETAHAAVVVRTNDAGLPTAAVARLCPHRHVDIARWGRVDSEGGWGCRHLAYRWRSSGELVAPARCAKFDAAVFELDVAGDDVYALLPAALASGEVA